MSVGPLGMAGSFAGTPLSQTNSSDVERTQQEEGVRARQARGEEKAEQAEGVGTTEEDQQVSDRDADGRRLWEAPPEEPEEEADEHAAEGFHAGDGSQPHSKDPTGQSGTQLDLSG